MKVYIILLTLIISSTLLSSPVFADEEWEEEPKENMNSAMLFSHSLYAPDVTCRINIMKDGSVTGYAIDYNWDGKVVTDTIALKTKNGEKVLERELFHYAPSDRFQIEGGYHAFEKKCVPRIGTLPPEIQEKFKGWFGIQ